MLATIYKELGLPDEAIAIAQGSLPLQRYEPPSARSRGLPPALLPLGEGSSGIVVGYWKHWFTPNRKLTVVEHYGVTIFGNPMLTMEWARNIKQMICINILESICIYICIEPQTVALADAVGITDLDAIERISEDTGDVVEGLLTLECFRADPPHSCFDDDKDYPGDFPHPGMEKDPTTLYSACGYEIHSRFGQGKPDPLRYRERVARMPRAPIWLRTGEQRGAFDELLRAGDFQGAWMSLNSIGWKLRDAIAAMGQLADVAADPRFSQYADYWMAQARNSPFGGY